VFLGLPDPDPDPLVRGMDPDLDPSIILLSSSKNSKKNFDSVEDSKTSRNMCEDLLGYSHKQAKY
jgi:hypothetical protein